MSRELKGLAIILGIYFIGEVITRLIGGFMPASVIGMLLLFGLLQGGIVAEEDIKGVCNFILSNMMLLFVPIGVGIMVSYKVLSDNWMVVVGIMLLTTIIVMIAVAIIQQFLGKRWRR